MAYTVELSDWAFADIDKIVVHIQNDSPRNATRWRKRLFEKLETLRRLPHGCAIAPENDHCPFEVRQTILGSYRVLFTIFESRSQVYVLTIRHASRRFMPGDQLRDSINEPPGREADTGEPED